MQNLPIFHLPASQPAIRLGGARCMAPEFLHNKSNHTGLTSVVLKNVYPLHHGASFYTLLVCFCL